MNGYRGTLLRVIEKEGKKGSYWAALIDTEKKGDVWFNAFSKDVGSALGKLDAAIVYAETPEENEGVAVIFDSQPGKVRDEETGERWNSTLTAIMAASESMEDEEGDQIAGQGDLYTAVNTIKAHLGAAMKALETIK